VSLFAVGDIHGNIRALESLLERIAPELSRGDTLVFLGDYIDRGPNTKECVDRIIALKEASVFSVVTLLGNHEDWMLRSYRDHFTHTWILGMEPFETTIASYSANAAHVLRQALKRDSMNIILGKSDLPYDLFFNAMPPKHSEFFQGLQRYYKTEDVLCAHGGIDPDIDALEKQRPDAFLWGSKTFSNRYAGEEHVVYGHHNNSILDEKGWPQPNIKPNRTYGIDTIAHGVLTAIRFPGREVFQSERFSL
jgi:serine/threonine protein phosphatase 1